MNRLWCACCGREMTGPGLACACPKGMAVPVPKPAKETGK